MEKRPWVLASPAIAVAAIATGIRLNKLVGDDAVNHPVAAWISNGLFTISGLWILALIGDWFRHRKMARLTIAGQAQDDRGFVYIRVENRGKLRQLGAQIIAIDPAVPKPLLPHDLVASGTHARTSMGGSVHFGLLRVMNPEQEIISLLDANGDDRLDIKKQPYRFTIRLYADNGESAEEVIDFDPAIPAPIRATIKTGTAK